MTQLPDALKERIKSPFVEQAEISWKRSTWLRWFQGDSMQTMLAALPDTVTRQSTATSVREFLEAGDVRSAFCAAMVWGHGPAGYGAYRTRTVLAGSKTASADDVVHHLSRAAAIADEKGAVEGFRYLNNEGHIAGLGPAFFTKWLYFSSAKGDPYRPGAALILDAVVRRWLRNTAGISIPAARTSGYKQYIDLIDEWAKASDEWAKASGWSAPQIEATIFQLGDRHRRSRV